MTRRPSSELLWACIRQQPGHALTSRGLALKTGLPVNIVSALLRRYADRGQLAIVGVGAQMAAGGLKPNVYRYDPPVKETP